MNRLFCDKKPVGGMPKTPDNRDEFGKEYAGRPVQIYMFGSLLLFVIGLAVLGAPLVNAYLQGGRYDAEKLDLADRKLALSHEVLWENLRLGWRQFWLGRVKARLANFHSFLRSQRLQNSVLAGDLMANLANLTVSYQESQGSQVDFYFVDERGSFEIIVDSEKPQWQSLKDLWPLYDELFYHFGDVYAQTLVDLAQQLFGNPEDIPEDQESENFDSPNYGQQDSFYDSMLAIEPQNREVVLILLFGDFIREGKHLHLAILLPMGSLLSQSGWFFEHFERRITLQSGQLWETILLAPENPSKNESPGRSPYFRSYGDEDFAKNWNGGLDKALNLDNDLGADAVYTVLAQLIFAMTLTKDAPQALGAGLATSPEKERGRRLQRELQPLRPMQPLIFSNVYQASGNESNIKPEVLSIGKLHAGTHNLVLLHSRFRGDNWWAEQEFFDLGYRKRLYNLLLFFGMFSLLIFSPLCLYAYFAGRYARDFFRVQKYIARLPFAALVKEGTQNIEGIKGITGESEKYEDAKPDLSFGVGVDEAHIASTRVIEQIQQNLLKLLEVVDYWREQSNVDGLTGLLNRKGMNQICVHEMNRMKRYGSMFSLIMLDIDYFKRINDEYGHDIGDLALKSLSRSLSENFRASDYICRWGGEEFLILLPDTSLEGAIQVAEGVRQSVEKLIIQANEILLRLTISLGVASNLHGTEFSETMNYADKSLYLAKQNGRNQVWVFGHQDGFFKPPKDFAVHPVRST